LWSWMSRVQVSSLTPEYWQVRRLQPDTVEASRHADVRFWERIGSESPRIGALLLCPRSPLERQRDGARLVTRQPKKLSTRAQRRLVERGPRECLFCGETKRLSEEHVFGQWLQKLGFAGPGAEELIEDAESRLRILRQGNPLNKRLRIVCEECNGGWMSRLEESAKSLLIEMFDPSSSITLNESDQLVLARWAFKSVAVISQLGSIKSFPLAHCRELYTTGNPPILSQIWIGTADMRVMELGTQIVASHWEPRKYDITVDGQTVQVSGYSARFRLVNVVFEFFGCVAVDDRAVRANHTPDLKHLLRPIWKAEESEIQWPIEGTLDILGGIEGLTAVPHVGSSTNSHGDIA
jgi:hypothetical protein